jgi:hypothetical protein
MTASSNPSSFPDIIDFGNASKMVSLLEKDYTGNQVYLQVLANRLIHIIIWVVTRVSSETNPT